MPNSENPRPTAAQRRELLFAIKHGTTVRPGVGASRHRMVRNMLLAGWIRDGRPTDAAYEALGVTRPNVSDQR